MARAHFGLDRKPEVGDTVHVELGDGTSLEGTVCDYRYRSHLVLDAATEYPQDGSPGRQVSQQDIPYRDIKSAYFS
tara:strand:- start:3752 stop:3979 length:228 start_codon:yes stop_codon:yes gene_type:complete